MNPQRQAPKQPIDQMDVFTIGQPGEGPMIYKEEIRAIGRIVGDPEYTVHAHTNPSRPEIWHDEPVAYNPYTTSTTSTTTSTSTVPPTSTSTPPPDTTPTPTTPPPPTTFAPTTPPPPTTHIPTTVSPNTTTSAP